MLGVAVSAALSASTEHSSAQMLPIATSVTSGALVYTTPLLVAPHLSSKVVPELSNNHIKL
jgi:hypothetical protein